jgi:hypothetical protein
MTSSLLRFLFKNIFFDFEKTLLPTLNAAMGPGANLAITSYNASAVKIYNA